MFIFAAIRRFVLFFFNDTATTEIYTLSLHDALPILLVSKFAGFLCELSEALRLLAGGFIRRVSHPPAGGRSEEHTSELQSRLHLVCRLLLEKKKKKNHLVHTTTR